MERWSRLELYRIFDSSAYRGIPVVWQEVPPVGHGPRAAPCRVRRYEVA